MKVIHDSFPKEEKERSQATYKQQQQQRKCVPINEQNSYEYFSFIQLYL